MSIDTQTIVDGYKKYPVLYICGIVSVVLLATLYFRSDVISAQQAELDEKIVQGTRYAANVSNVSQLKEQYDFLVDANAAVRKRAIRGDELAGNLQYFYRLESDTGVKLKDLRPSTSSTASKTKSIYVPINFVLSVQGDFPQVISFIRRLEQGTHFCRINTVIASSGATTGPVMTWNLNIDLLAMP